MLKNRNFLLVAFAWAARLPLRADQLPPIRTVFVIIMENHSWSDIQNRPSAPYLNNILLPAGSHCEAYSNLFGVHPSLPNYLWIEAGTNFGIQDDSDPIYHHQNTTNHLTTLLRNAGVSWKAYQEHINSNSLPLSTCCGWSSRHNPFLYFDDVTGTNDPYYPYGVGHIRPYSELAADLTNNSVASYNFIIPDDCHDMHDVCGLGDAILQGDTWLASEVPHILDSQAFTNSGVLFIMFDESYSGDTRLTFIALSPFAKGGGYASLIPYDHSSLLRTLQEVFQVTPYLGSVSNAANLSDLFLPPGAHLQISSIVGVVPAVFKITISGLAANVPFCLQGSSNLTVWTDLCTNSSATAAAELLVTNSPPGGPLHLFYRVRQASP
jgi:hypothetical protein